MRRRDFLAASCVTGLASLSGGVAAALGQGTLPRRAGETDAAYQARVARIRAAQPSDSAAASNVPRLPNETDAQYQARVANLRAAREAQRYAREFLELQRYEIETSAQKAAFDAFAAEALIPALNRMGIKSVGVFYPSEGISPICVLLSSPSVQSLTTATIKLSADKEFEQKGSAFLDAPADKPAFKRMTSQLMLAFEGMPKVERPIDSPGRIFQLRTNENPSVKAGLRKIEMFNKGEIAIFRKTGLLPVFMGQTLVGEKMPSLTYMLTFSSMEESKANWEKFKADPDWKALSAKPEYDDKKNICATTNVYLKPASYSQI
jgi:hypothetical protein